MATTSDAWWLLSNHGLVLAALALHGPALTLREIGDLVGVRERAAFRLVADLEGAGYLTAHKVGRRNRYELHPETPLRHPLVRDLTFGDLLGSVLAHGAASTAATEDTTVDLRAAEAEQPTP